VAIGRTDLIAKVHWAELIPYFIAAIVLIHFFGIVGAAAAWSVRVIFDSFLFLWLSRVVVKVNVPFSKIAFAVLVGIAVLLPSPLIALYNNFSPVLLLTIPLSVAVYLWIAFRLFVTEGEREWFIEKIPVKFRGLISKVA
jgi:O-antigen/teichoic acid export membrane protein